jgi:hypothetical protein
MQRTHRPTCHSRPACCCCGARTAAQPAIR